MLSRHVLKERILYSGIAVGSCDSIGGGNTLGLDDSAE